MKSIEHPSPELHPITASTEVNCIMLILLIENGINIMAQNSRGITAADLAKMDWSNTDFIGQSLQIKLNRSEIDKGRTQVAQLLE